MRNRKFLVLIVVPLTLIITGCAGMYFHEAPAPAPQIHYALHDWPYQEYWTGIVFNGEKIGYTHLSLQPAQEGKRRFDIRSEAVMRFRFLTFDKKVNLVSFDQVAQDLSLQEFTYEYDLDGNSLALTGAVVGGALELEITSGHQQTHQKIPLDGRLYPASVIALYPVLNGLELGKHYEYPVYFGETQSIETVTQDIVGYEQSDLFTGSAYKIKTRVQGQQVTSWIDQQGKPVLEISMGGIIISGLEPEERARKYVALGALNKQEFILEFALIRTAVPLQDPRKVVSLDIALEGITEDFPVPSDTLQNCERNDGQVDCYIISQLPPQFHVDERGASVDIEPFLQSSLSVPAAHTLIDRMAHAIAQNATNTSEQVRMLIDWIQDNIEREPVDVFSALDVLDQRKAECQGHTYLYASFARALGIATRVANGIVYSEEFNGFLYHTWAESLIGGQWTRVDPTFGQVPADATHIKFIEGEHLADLAPLVKVIGRVKVDVIAVGY
ncbi:MAG: transglutaminase-like domain-containing protein [Gammaproteobacteria bacterium]|nr:transglutaminase-like domain-containing protein [Gammaproteobacteria bacterium]MCI0590098.1 transglutaminase-like domain-containing protein [Gammaproteobacteria bacterium]